MELRAAFGTSPFSSKLHFHNFSYVFMMIKEETLGFSGKSAQFPPFSYKPRNHVNLCFKPEVFRKSNGMSVNILKLSHFSFFFPWTIMGSQLYSCFVHGSPKSWNFIEFFMNR